MAIYKSRWPLALLGIYWSLLFIVNHIPLPTIELPGGKDKLAHVLLFVGLTVLLGWNLRYYGASWAKTIIVTFLTVAAYGGLDEWLQTFVVGRTPDFADWVADLVGAAGGLAALAALSWIGGDWGRESPSEDRQQ